MMGKLGVGRVKGMRGGGGGAVPCLQIDSGQSMGRSPLQRPLRLAASPPAQQGVLMESVSEPKQMREGVRLDKGAAGQIGDHHGPRSRNARG